MASAWAAGETLLARPGAGWVLLVALALVYTHVYSTHPQNPGSVSPLLRQGWWAWADQFEYWASARELADGRLTADGYHYPLGYPLLGAVAWLLMPVHAFFLPNLLLILAAAAAWWRWARAWLDRRLTLLLMVGFMLLHRDLLVLTQVIPWNTIASQATLLACLATLFVIAGTRAVVVLTALAVLTYVIRPGDAVCFAPLLVWSVLRLPNWRQRWAYGAAGVGVILAAVAVVALVNRSVFGTWDTPYERMTWEAVGFGGYPFEFKLYGLMVDGGTFFGEAGTALLFAYPWLFAVLPGLVHAVNRHGANALAALLAIGMSWLLYLNYNDFQPSAVFRYSLIHYVSWTFPVLFTLAVAALVQGWRQRCVRIAGAVAAVVAVFATGIGLELRRRDLPVAPGRVEVQTAARPLWIEFPGMAREREAEVRLDGKVMSARACQVAQVGADLRLLLSTAAQGIYLTVPDPSVPLAGDFVWRWRWSPERWRAVASSEEPAMAARP